MTTATKGGVKAPPQRADSHMMPCARARSRSGSQVVNVLVRLGKPPASPAPNRARVTSSEGRFQTQAVAAVKKLHHGAMKSSTRRGPAQSPR